MEARSTKYTATQGKQISPTDLESCSTILDKLQEDRLLKVKKRSFRPSGGATVSQTPELASSEGNEEEESDGFVCTGGRRNSLKERLPPFSALETTKTAG